MKKYLRVIVALFLLAGCQSLKKHQDKVNEEPEEIVETPEQPAGESPEAYFFPLTGERAENRVNNRPVAVMINNHPKARPQAGLGQADIVYETLAEGEITRFLAVYQSEQPAVIGPVRSARDYYIDMSKGYNALYISHGWSPEAKQILESGEIDHLNGLFYDGTLFERVRFRKAPHNSYISYDNILKGARLKGYEMELETEPLFFENNPVIEGKDALKVTISYSKGSISKVEYVYDKNTNKYSRLNNGERLIDSNTERPIQIDNLLIVEMEHEVIDQKGRRSIDLFSGGEGYLLQNGIGQPIQWKNIGGRILPYSGENALPLLKGKTWVNVIPTSPGFERAVSIESNEKGV